MDRVGNEKCSVTELNIPVAEKTMITEATIVAINPDGYAVTASKTEGLLIAGCAQRFADNALGAAGDVKVLVRRGAFVWNNDGTIKETDILKDCYVSDATTVTITADGSSKAGKILAVDSDGVTVDMTNIVNLLEANSSDGE